MFLWACESQSQNDKVPWQTQGTQPANLKDQTWVTASCKLQKSGGRRIVERCSHNLFLLNLQDWNRTKMTKYFCFILGVLFSIFEWWFCHLRFKNKNIFVFYYINLIIKILDLYVCDQQIVQMRYHQMLNCAIVPDNNRGRAWPTVLNPCTTTSGMCSNRLLKCPTSSCCFNKSVEVEVKSSDSWLHGAQFKRSRVLRNVFLN